MKINTKSVYSDVLYEFDRSVYILRFPTLGINELVFIYKTEKNLCVDWKPFTIPFLVQIKASPQVLKP